MDEAKSVSSKELPLIPDPNEDNGLSKILSDFANIPTIDKAWIFKSGSDSNAMFSISQPNFSTNKRRKFLMPAYVQKDGNGNVAFKWSKFPVEIPSASIVVPSPSCSKLLVVRNPENDSPTAFEIWDQGHLEKEFSIPQTIHGSVYADGWFEGVSWNSKETLIAYVAEEPSLPKPTFGNSYDKDSNTWKGQGEWEEEWGESYMNKRRPTVFVIDVESGEVNEAKGIKRSLSVGQVVWAPSVADSQQGLVFVGWSSEPRKLGIKYCYNRPCALYFIHCTFGESEANESSTRIINLTEGTSSAFFPRFSPDGKSLVFVSSKSAVESGAHSATNSLHKIDWPLGLSPKIIDLIPVVMCPKDNSFPGLYCSTVLTNPWLSNCRYLILSSVWESAQVILSVDTFSGLVTRITPPDPLSSWNLLALDEDNIIAVCYSIVDVPRIKYGFHTKESSAKTTSAWSWQDLPCPSFKCSAKVESLVSANQCSIVKIPIKNASKNPTEGAKQPFDAILVSSKEKKSNNVCDPLIVFLHGGPHTAYPWASCKSLAFLSSIGYNILIVNYRGTLGFGEEALQSLPGNVGSQDVNDVVTAIDYVIEKKLVNPSKIAVLGGSHGGFLTTHLIGQAPERFAAAATRNPVCNIQSMFGTSDIPDWCFLECNGSENNQAKSRFTLAPPLEQLDVFYQMSPISHIHKVKTPILFLIGAQDLRVPPSNGLQYARALKERGVEVKIIVFPEDTHGIERPQSDFESFVNIAVWFNKYCK